MKYSSDCVLGHTETEQGKKSPCPDPSSWS